MSDDEPKGCLTAILGLFGIKSDKPIPVEKEVQFRQRDDFLSAAEFSFYRVLANAVGNLAVICCKVNLADLFHVPGRNKGSMNKIDRKHVDFLLCDPVTMRPRCGIELDDKSHARPSRQDRDEFVNQVFNQASLPLVRVKAQAAYHPSSLLALIEPHLEGTRAVTATPQIAAANGSTNCSRCGVLMVERVATKGQHAGKRFLACPNYPRCKEIVPIAG